METAGTAKTRGDGKKREEKERRTGEGERAGESWTITISGTKRIASLATSSTVFWAVRRLRAAFDPVSCATVLFLLFSLTLLDRAQIPRATTRSISNNRSRAAPIDRSIPCERRGYILDVDRVTSSQVFVVSSHRRFVLRVAFAGSRNRHARTYRSANRVPRVREYEARKIRWNRNESTYRNRRRRLGRSIATHP